jgi:transcriptional regulator with XRE-family HTH domain
MIAKRQASISDVVTPRFGLSDMLLRLGSDVRRRRRSLGLSLSDLAERTGLSISFISMVEQGKSDISIGRLTRIMEALQMVWIDMLGEVQSLKPIVRRADEELRPIAEGSVFVQILASGLRGIPVHSRLIFEPGASLQFSDLKVPVGETFCLVMAGEVLFDFGESNLALLSEGDSIAYENASFRQARNPGRTQAVMYQEIIAGLGADLRRPDATDVWMKSRLKNWHFKITKILLSSNPVSERGGNRRRVSWFGIGCTPKDRLMWSDSALLRPCRHHLADSPIRYFEIDARRAAHECDVAHRSRIRRSKLA